MFKHYWLFLLMFESFLEILFSSIAICVIAQVLPTFNGQELIQPFKSFLSLMKGQIIIQHLAFYKLKYFSLKCEVITQQIGK